MVYVHWIFFALYVCIVVSAAVAVLMDNRQPAKTLAWLLVLIFLPVVGLVFYFFFGQNTRKERFISQQSMDQLTKRSMFNFAEQQNLVVPKEHICCAAKIDESNSGVVAHCFEVIAKICKELGVESYRIVNNCGDQAGQTVKHLHFHVLSGRDMTWPPG